MRVLFVGSHRSDKQFSILGFESVLTRLLADRCHIERVFPGKDVADARESKWRRYADKYVFFPRLLRQRARGMDLVHFCEQGVGLNLMHVSSHKTLVTIHDFLALEAAKGEFPGWEVSRSGRKYQSWILSAVMQASGIACVSDTTRQGMNRHMYGYTGQVRTILNGMYKSFHRIEAGLAKSLLPKLDAERFFFHVGGNKPYKNRAGVLRVFAELKKTVGAGEYGLVMAGGGPTAQLLSLSAELGLDKDVQWLTQPTDAQIEALYSLATALVFPSWAEGFGLPIIEAQSCGCPVFAANRPPMTEIGDRSVVYFDPAYPAEAAMQIATHLDSLDELATLGAENVKRFDPQLMADGYFDFYRALCDAGS